MMMPKAETLEEFYQHKFAQPPGHIQQGIGHFNVFRLEDCIDQPVNYSHRDFYKIVLIHGNDMAINPATRRRQPK